MHDLAPLLQVELQKWREALRVGEANASTDDLIFDVATLIAEISLALTLKPGDLIVTDTPSGVSVERSPQLFKKLGDVCEDEVENIGTCAIPSLMSWLPEAALRHSQPATTARYSHLFDDPLRTDTKRAVQS